MWSKRGLMALLRLVAFTIILNTVDGRRLGGSPTDFDLQPNLAAPVQNSSQAVPSPLLLATSSGKAEIITWLSRAESWVWQQPALLCLSVVGILIGLTLPAAEASDTSKWTAFYMTVYVAFGCTEYILVRWISEKHDGLPFAPVAGVVCMETSKLVFTAGLISYSGAWQRFKEIERFDAMILFIPAVMYMILNSLFYFAVSHVTVASYAIVFEVQIIFVALLWMVVFKRWLSITRGVACVGIVFAALLHHAGESGGEGLDMGMWLPALVALWAAISTITCEKVFKAGASLDINVQNTFMYSYGILFGISLLLLKAYFFSEHVSEYSRGLNHPEVIVLLSIRACHGIAASRILKYIDSVSKTIGAALTGPLAIGLAPFFVHEDVTTYTFVAVLITSLSSFVFWSDANFSWLFPQKKQETPA